MRDDQGASLFPCASAFVNDPDFVLHLGDVRDTLATFPDDSVDCVATSPPFYGLRDYGTGAWEGGSEDCDHQVREEFKVASSTLEGGTATTGHQREGYKGVCGRCGAVRVDRQIGLEDSPDAWVDVLVDVFAACRRVLKPTGTLWIECGDSYVSGQGGRQSAVGELPPTTRFDRKVERPCPHLSDPTRYHIDAPDGYELPEKRTGILCEVCQGSGRIVRDDVDVSSWSTRDVGPRFYPGRDTGLKPKDLLGQPWMLAFGLRADGWWLRQSIIWHKPNAMPESATDRCTTAHSYVFLLSKSARYHFDAEAIAEPAEWARWGDQTVPKYEGTDTSSGWMQPKSKAELRAAVKGTSWESGGLDHGKSTWPDGRKTGYTISDHEPPQEENLLVARGGRTTNGQKSRTDERRGFDNRLDRADGKKNPRSVWTIPTQGYSEAHFATWPEALCERIIKAGCPEGGTVLDPFMGSGTTALVARRLGRKAVGIELNPEYAELCARRLSQQSLLAEDVA